MRDTDEDRQNRRDEFAKLALAYQGIAPRGLCEIGFMLQDYLGIAVADADTHVDKGMGLGSFNLWVTVDGREYYIEIKERSHA